MLLIAALLLVSVASLGVCVAALANPRDPIDELLTEAKPWECSRCGGDWDDLAAFFGHECKPSHSSHIAGPFFGNQT